MRISGQIRGMSNWNMDLNIAKDFAVFRERAYATLSFQFTNVFNHEVLADPFLSIASPATGASRFQREWLSELASPAHFQPSR